MRRMFSEKQILELIKKNPQAVVKALLGQDISVEGITSKGIANTGALGNIGNVAISGDLSVSGSINGEENPSVKPIYWHSCSMKRVDGGTTLGFYFDFIILNNSPTAFTKESLISWLSEHQGVKIKIVQGYHKDYPSDIVSSFQYGNENTIVFNSEALDGTSHTASFNIASAVFTDVGVNKIN